MRFVYTVLLTAAGAAVCATLAEFRLIGWSETGEFLAWEQHGWSDGAGLPWAEVTVVYTPDGEVVYRADSFPSEETCLEWSYDGEMNHVRAALLEEAMPLMDSLGIVAGSTGSLLVHHPITDFTADPGYLRFHGWAMSADYHGPEYVLELTELESGARQTPEWYPPPVLLLLTLDQAEGDTLTLVSDSMLIHEYQYVFGYRIRDVCTYMDRFVAVVLNTVVPGFEGADGGFRVVCGVLPGSRSLMP